MISLAAALAERLWAEIVWCRLTELVVGESGKEVEEIAWLDIVMGKEKAGCEHHHVFTHQ
jgi:hypothetical protein